ncbi:putative transcription factor B3-Domain family [Helianthus anomalus]
MVYGFAGQVWNNEKKSMKLPGKYGEWIKTINYSEKNAVIRTLDGRIFKVNVVFQYEEALSYFRVFYFYQDISLVLSDYFYYKSRTVKDRDICMHVNKCFVHHKMMNVVPSYPVVIWSSRNRKWFVRMDVIDNELYITTGWNQIKKEMSITDDHLVVFEILDLNTFEISVISCKPALLCYPPELCVIKQEPTYDLIEVSDDEGANPIAEVDVEHNQDDVVPVTFRVDNRYDHGLDRKVGLTIKDNFGGLWEVEIGVEYSQGCSRYNVTGMNKFVRDKQMVYGDVFQLFM